MTRTGPTRSTEVEQIPDWAWEVLAAPGGGPLQCEDGVLWSGERRVGHVDQGILCFEMPGRDASAEYYRAIAGAHFYERAGVPYAMSALDTPVYHDYLRGFAPDDRDMLVVDVGGGDGRNAAPWLEWGFKRVVVVDASRAGLSRFRARLLARNRDWLERVALIECDARSLPLVALAADRVLAIETLYYLNEDYESGLRECCRVMRPLARLLLSERSYEGALLTRLIYYGGIGAMLETANSRELWDGEGELRVRTRCFSRSELHALVGAQGLGIVGSLGISGFSLVLSWLAKLERLGPESEARLAAVQRLLIGLGNTGSWSRCHVVIAEKRGATL